MGGWGGKAEGLEPICQLVKVAVRKLNKDPILSVKGGGDFGEQEALSGIHCLLII